MTIDLAEQLGLHLDRLLENCQRSVEDLTADELNHQPSERAHSIGFDIWHVVRTVDNIVFFVFDRQKPVWLSGGFDERFGLPRVAQGTGMTDEEARALRFPEPSAFVGYIDAVRAASVERVRSMSDDELAEVTKVNPWGDRSKAEHILQVLIAHGNGHIGRCSLARALLGKDDLGILVPAGVTMEVRRIRPGEFEAYREVRLRALRLAPYAFGTTLEEAASRSDDEWRAFSDRLATSTETAGFIVDRGEGVPGGLVSVRLLVEPGDVPSDAEVNQMWVDEDLRGGPWAGALLDAVEGFARAIGVRRLTLWVTEGNPRAFRVYERHGYTPTGVIEPFPRGGIETQLGKALT